VASKGSFSMFNVDINMLKISITDTINGIPVGLCWKMISLGIQGPVKLEEQVKVLHVFVNKMDATIAKPCLIKVYASHLVREDHDFPLKIKMRLVPEMDLVLNRKGCKSVDKLRACQNTWNTSKLICIKTWEIKLLDDQNDKL